VHRHDAEDELFYVIDGELWISCGDVEGVHGAGSVVWLPRGLPHTFQVRSETARVFQVSTPGQFERLVATLGEPVASPDIPDPVEVDVARVAEVCAQFSIQVLGPPPEPVAD
jgi:dTDP-4-dehydrorhamnose 3,5-epimerase-like enzyme